MVEVRNECVGCRDLGLPCMGNECPNRSVERFYCDNCKDETDELYDVYGDILCRDCLLDFFPKFTGD